MKAAILARVSSRDQEETGYSLPAQEKFLSDYADKHQFEVAQCFCCARFKTPQFTVV